MNEQGFKLIAATLQAAYSKEQRFLEDQNAVRMWYGFLKELPYDLTAEAVKEWIASNKWSPTIADIRGAVAEKMKESLADRVKDYGEDYFRTLYEKRQKVLPETQEDIIREYSEVKRIGEGNDL